MSRVPLSRKLYPFDWLIIGYSLLMVVLIVIAGRPLSEYVDELLFYSGTAIVAALVGHLLPDQTGRIAAFFRLLYPMFLFTLFYRETQGLIFLFFDRFYDGGLVAFETAIFGMDPSLFFDQHLPNVPVTELLSACYFSYYLMIPVFLVSLFVTRRDELIRRSLAAVCIMFFASYLLFSLYPIEGPRWHFAGQYTNEIEGLIFRPMVNLVIAKGAVHGGCMPSSHVGVALVILLYSLRIKRRIGWWLIPVNVGLAAGTVWGRYHYVSDVVVGALIGAGAVLLVDRYYDRFAGPVKEPESSREVVYHNAS